MTTALVIFALTYLAVAGARLPRLLGTSMANLIVFAHFGHARARVGSALGAAIRWFLAP